MTIEPLTPAVRLSSGTNPSIVQTGVTFSAIVSSTAGHADRQRNFPGRHNAAGPGVTLRGRGRRCTNSSLSDGSHSITAVYNGDSKLRRRQERGIIAVGPRLQLDARFGQQWRTRQRIRQRHYANRGSRWVGYLPAEHHTQHRRPVPNPDSINGYRHAVGCYRSHRSRFVDPDYREHVDAAGEHPAPHHDTDDPVARRFGRA